MIDNSYHWKLIFKDWDLNHTIIGHLAISCPVLRPHSDGTSLNFTEGFRHNFIPPDDTHSRLK